MITPMESIPFNQTRSPLEQRLTLEGTGINMSFLGKGKRYNSSVPWDWNASGGTASGSGEDYPYGQTPSSTDVTKKKTTATIKAGVDWGKFSLFGEASKSQQTFLNKPFKGFKEDTDYSGTTIQSQNQEGWPITVTGQRDVAGDTRTTFGNISKTRFGGGGKIHLGGDRKPGFMAILEGSGGTEKTSQRWSTDVATGKPISTASNMWAGYAGGGPGSIDPSQGSSGTTTSTKLYGSGRLSFLYGQKGETGGSSCFGGNCSWSQSSPTFNFGAFAEHDTDEGTSYGATAKYGMLSGEIKKKISGGISGNINLSIPLSWSR